MAGYEDNELPRFLRAYDPGQVIFGEGSRGDTMYVVQDGSVDIHKLQGNTAVRLAALGKGEFFGEMALVDHGLRSASAVAGAEGARVLAIDRAHFVFLVSQQPSFALVVLEVIVKRLRGQYERAAHAEAAA